MSMRKFFKFLDDMGKTIRGIPNTTTYSQKPNSAERLVAGLLGGILTAIIIGFPIFLGNVLTSVVCLKVFGIFVAVITLSIIGGLVLGYIGKVVTSIYAKVEKFQKILRGIEKMGQDNS